ncbi:High nitrogen upregulated cytochrome P450 monooxygenase 2 [Mycena sanguinolenta]|uniref:High nitrogen upregulated cytochrome P450 monooxygenase 2 n=1 Tax=Mycena sanguinolenta TaxID=230812 RepID=A0A8H7DJY7_9AGAR|nr:High nitrogen upregulated cytochrome P450 monooxygenase 2 [Mycena sanguinolenta]
MPTAPTWVALALTVHLFCHVHEPRTAHGGFALVLLSPALTFFIFIVTGAPPPSIISVLASYTYFVISLGASIVLYRLSPLHPLYHIPGPLLAKISKLYGLWMTWTGHQHIHMRRAHDKYGPVVRTGPNEVSIADVDAVTSVLGSGGLPKGQFYSARQDPAAPANLLVLHGEPHANRRRLWNRGMSTESLSEYQQVIAKRATQLLDAIADAGVLDFAAWISYFTFDFMGDMAFGGGFELLANPAERTDIWPLMGRFSVFMSFFTHVPWLASSLLHVRIPVRDRMRKFGVENALRRSKSTAQTKDLWYHLMDDAGLEKQKPPLGNVVADGALAIVAGADTTASVLSSLFFLLLSNPKYYEQLQAEIDVHFPPGADPLDPKPHADMKFLNACINETLRLHPPVRTSGPRQVPADSQGKVIAGVFIPPCTQIYVPPYSLHHSSQYFSPSPDAFLPERWLDPALAPSNPTAFIPFSYGPANCVGRNLARLEMNMVVCLLLSRLRFRFADGFEVEKWVEQMHDHFITTKGALMVEVERR